MKFFKVKICGITSAEDGIAAIRSGADAIGLNFYAKSSRFINLDRAVQVSSVIRNELDNTNASFVGVFVNESPEIMLEVANRVNLDAVQLHGDEEPSILENLDGFKAIRAIRVENVGQAQDEIDRWQSAGIDAVLVDAASPNAYGGTGERLDWTRVAKLKSDVPLVLAGGLTADNVSHAISQARVQSVDVASGVEIRPGVKAHDQLRLFVANSLDAIGE